MARRRIFTDNDRQKFFNAIRVMRDACIEVRCKEPSGEGFLNSRTWT